MKSVEIKETEIVYTETLQTGQKFLFFILSFPFKPKTDEIVMQTQPFFICYF